MNDRVDGFLPKYGEKIFAVQKINLIKFYRSARNLLHPTDSLLAGIDKIVHYDNLIAPL